MPTEIKIDAGHIEVLLKKLDEYSERYLDGSYRENKKFLYFTDTDILVEYILGFCSNPIKSWSSLLSLRREDRLEKSNESAKKIANKIGKVVSRYLFGDFGRDLDLQRGRIYITPEHDRELKSIIRAILLNVNSVDFSMVSGLRDDYLNLADRGLIVGDAEKSTDSIVAFLDKYVEIGNVGRAYSLLRNSTSVLSTNIIYSREESIGSILFSSVDDTYVGYVDKSRDAAWDSFERGLRPQLGKDGGELLDLKRFAFNIHADASAATKSFAYFDQEIREWLESDKYLRKMLHSPDLSRQIAIAVRQAADLSACARINGMGLWLNKIKPIPSDGCWEMVFLSGSQRWAEVVRDWNHNIISCAISVVNPLSMLRHPDLWDPAGAKNLNDAPYAEKHHVFALFNIFRAAEDKSRTLVHFLDSFQKQLNLVIVRDAPEHDSGLSKLMKSLVEGGGFNPEVFHENVRKLIVLRFAQTYDCLVELFPGEKTPLPANSLPVLDLPNSETASRFVRDVRLYLSGEKKKMLGFKELERASVEDPTGYSTLLALAIGYMARGKQWVPAAQTMAATAAFFAKGRELVADNYPEGNEALYLEAFLLRMSQGVGMDAKEFRDRHESIMKAAASTLDNWSEKFETQSFSPVTSVKRAVRVRYRLEDNARDVFCALIDRLSSSGIVEIDSIARIAESSLQLYSEVRAGEQPGENARQKYSSATQFNLIQAGLSVMQAWLLWRESEIKLGADSLSDRLRDFEIRLAEVVRNIYPDRQLFGKLIPCLAYIFEKHTKLTGMWIGREAFDQADKVIGIRFAGIDEARMKWLKEHIY